MASVSCRSSIACSAVLLRQASAAGWGAAQPLAGLLRPLRYLGGAKKGGGAPGVHSRPHSAIERTWSPATIMWSSTRTSTSDKADFSVCVRCSSARDGSATPEGC